MNHEDWKLAVDPARPRIRTARLLKVNVPSCALLGLACGVAGTVLFLPLQRFLFAFFEQRLTGACEVSGAIVGAFDVPLILLLLAFEALVGACLGGFLAAAFNLLSPAMGGLDLELELEAHGTGRRALDAYSEQPVFEGR